VKIFPLNLTSDPSSANNSNGYIIPPFSIYVALYVIDRDFIPFI